MILHSKQTDTKNSVHAINWENIDWSANQKTLFKMQKRIYKLSLIVNDDNAVQWKRTKASHNMHYYQGLILKSLPARQLAVRKITTDNSGKKTPGVDKNVYLNPEEKMSILRYLKMDGKAAPIRRVMIPKPGKKEKRPLGIPIVIDRAKQALVVFALEPEWEAKFEANSYGFRPGRRTHDAAEAIFTHTRGENGAQKFVLDADLKGCFDNIDHNYLLNCLSPQLPKMRNQIKSWLKAGFVNGFLDLDTYNQIEKNSRGTPQGGVISPLLSNIALHGAENMLKQWAMTARDPKGGKGADAFFVKTKFNNKIDRANSLGFIRYADDFVLIHKEKRVLIAAREKLSEFFAKTSKLTFNENKTTLKPVSQGFDFFGFSFTNVARNGKTRIKIVPSRKSIKNHLDSLRNVIQKNKASSAYVLITKLRPIILGWAYYHRFNECNLTFRKIYNLLFQKLRAWVFRRDRRNGRIKVKEKYFPTGKFYKYYPPVGANLSKSTQRQVRIHYDNWILVGTTKNTKGKLIQNNIIPHSWVLSEKYVKVKGKASPFDGNLKYWNKRNIQFGGFTPSQSLLLSDQEYMCPLCKQPINYYDVVDVDHINGKGCNTYTNLQVLHRHCHRITKESHARKAKDLIHS